MNIERMASAIFNDIKSGLSGFTSNENLSIEQLKDDIVAERLAIIETYQMQYKLSVNDLYESLGCIPVDCKSMDYCCNGSTGLEEKMSHFEIPQLITQHNLEAIKFIGGSKTKSGFKIYLDETYKDEKLSRMPSFRPYVYIDNTINENGLVDGWIFNAPLLERVFVTGIFKDPRQILPYMCCETQDTMTSLDTKVSDSLTKKKLAYYRQYVAQGQPNNQVSR